MVTDARPAWTAVRRAPGGWPCSSLPLLGLALAACRPRAGPAVGAPAEPLLDRAGQRGAERRPRLCHERGRRPAPRRPGDPRLARVPRGGRVPRPACARDARRAAPGPEHRVHDRHAGRADDRGRLRGGLGDRSRRPATQPPSSAGAARCSCSPWPRSPPGVSSRSPACRRSTAPSPHARVRASWRRSRSSAWRSTAGRRGARWTCIAHGPVPCRSRSPWASCCSPRRWSPSRSAATGTSRGGSGTC